ncbi:MAG: Txe/YoeB family addiction module toxin [Salinivirgaceae bacterium]
MTNMVLTFTENAWEDYLYWQEIDKKISKKINGLIKEIKRTPFEGSGQPEPLKYDLSGYWSRRIFNEHRLVYQIVENEIRIYSCRFHYD